MSEKEGVRRQQGSGYGILRRHGNSGQITIPAEIAIHIPDEVRFSVGLTDEGILLRPLEKLEKPSLPAWLEEP